MNQMEAAFKAGAGQLVRACYPKTMHASEGAAAAQLRSLSKTDKLKNAETARTYRCRHCGGWHVGHPDGSGKKGWHR